MSSNPSDEPYVPRSNLGCFLMLLPIVMGAAVVLAYGYLFYTGSQGRAPEGDRVEIAFEGCDEARPLVIARVTQMGLGDPAWDDTPEGFAVTATLPRETADDIPATLARTGAFEVRTSADDVLLTHEQITDVNLTLSFIGEPSILVQLDDDGTDALKGHAEQHPGDHLVFLLDGVEVAARQQVTPGSRLELEPETDDLGQALREAAATSVVLGNGPLPCPLVVETRTVKAAAPLE